jgi:hypothetical protein
LQGLALRFELFDGGDVQHETALQQQFGDGLGIGTNLAGIQHDEFSFLQ